MRTAVVQLASSIDPVANRAQIDDRLSALDADVDLVVLPEASMHDFGSADHDLAAAAEPLDGPFVQLLADHARRLDATVVGGTFEQVPGRLPFNTLVALGADGDLAATYRKVHLYDSFGYRESDRLSPGEVTPVVLPVGDVAVGLMTCYDLRFPELGRVLTTAGAEVLAIPAAWVAGDHKLLHWRTLLAARAIENTVFVVAAAQGSRRYTGHSLVIDPMGLVLAEAGEDDETLVTPLDPGSVAAVREVNPSLANRRMT